MTPGLIVAIAAFVVSLGALWYAGSQARSARRSASAAVEQARSAREQALAAHEQVSLARDQVAASQRQIELQEEARRDAAQPYVVVDVATDRSQGSLFQVVLTNTGPTMARNVRVTFDPPLPKRLGGDRGPFSALDDGLSYLPPGRSMTWALGISFAYFEDEQPPPITTVTVRCDGPFGSVEPLSYSISFAELGPQTDIKQGRLADVESAIKALTKVVEQVARQR